MSLFNHSHSHDGGCVGHHFLHMFPARKLEQLSSWISVRDTLPCSDHGTPANRGSWGSATKRSVPNVGDPNHNWHGTAGTFHLPRLKGGFSVRVPPWSKENRAHIAAGVCAACECSLVWPKKAINRTPNKIHKLKTWELFHEVIWG